MANTDPKVLNLIKLAKEKKDAIAKIEKTSPKTNCSFGFTINSSDRTNIHIVTDINLLVTILAHLMEKQTFFIQACDELKITNEKFKWMGYTFEEWKHDIVNRIKKIEINKEKSSLEIIENRLNDLISPELRAELELSEIENLLK